MSRLATFDLAAARAAFEQAPSDPVHWPEYCCAILRDADGRYLLEQRPPDAHDAPGQLTCFGGKRNRAEHPHRCIRRELFEELRWRIGALRIEVGVRLQNPDGRAIAWFYRAPGPGPGVRIRPLKGVKAVWLAPEDLDSADLSAWHRSALLAEREGRTIAQTV